MATFFDFGSVLSLSGVGGITTSYQSGSAFLIGGASTVKLKVAIATDALSTMTSVTVKVQGLWTSGGTDLGDLISYRLDTNTNQPELAHQYTGLAAGSSYTFFVKVLDHQLFKGGLQVSALAGFSSGTSKAGDSVVVSAMGW